MKEVPTIKIDPEVIADNFRQDMQDLIKEKKEILGLLASEVELEKAALQSEEGAEQLRRYVSVKKRQVAILQSVGDRFPEDSHLFLEMYKLLVDVRNVKRP